MTVRIHSRELLAQRSEHIQIPAGLDIREHVKEAGRDKNGLVYEFIGTDTFGDEWVTRQRFEVNAGREEEPLLYLPIYNTIRDASLPEIIPISTIGPAGVVFEEVLEGGEVKFASIGSGSKSVTLRQFGTALEYSKRLVIFNQLWNVSLVERQVGVAYNALMNHLHLSPILTYSYAAANQTAASAIGSTLEEKYLRTLEDAITNSKTDGTNRRPGPYALLVNAGQAFTMERALFKVAQTGFTKQSSAIDAIRDVIVYDGWSGTRGKKATTYAGVTTGKAYLVNLGYKDQDFQSYIKQDLMSEMGNPDISRFIKEQIVWDTFLGVYSNPVGSVEEITLPTS
jgi:hypothetical protein